jgi:hypothetical protein
VRENQLSCASWPHGKLCVIRNTLARPERKAQAGLELDENDSAVLILLADDSL